jgi:NADP-dependent 3-hydroxy acid dehydrogenase YdfG
VVWIVGAGSGIGRASAVELARSGWVVALSGRRQDALDETAESVQGAGGEPLVLPLDVREGSPAELVDTVLHTWGRLDGLVLAAGTNTPRRTWADQRLEDFHDIVQTNLVGVVRVLHAALPALRSSRGQLVLVSSFAGWTYQPSAGIAYGATKTALGTLARSINSQEAQAGVRACHLCPGDVDTEFLRMRPEVPDEAARAVMLAASDVAAAVGFVLNGPEHVRVDELVISPVSQVPRA